MNHIYTCIVCGSEFKSFNPNPQYCSLACKSRAQQTPIDADRVIELYQSGMTQDEVAKALSTSQKVIYNTLKRAGVRARIAAKRNQRGENNDFWKGGRTINAAGYVLVRKLDHARAASNCGYVFEHDLVAEQKLGRPLKWFGMGHPNTEIVHHINGNKKDNRPENLAILACSEHSKVHNAMRKKSC